MSLKNAKKQGQAQYDGIREFAARLKDDSGNDRVRAEIQQDALSVLVRAGWHEPGKDAGKAEEFEILLCTGGPAVRLIGTLNRYCEPESATMQVQDWFEPWTDFYPAGDEDSDAVLLAYAGCFYFGE